MEIIFGCTNTQLTGPIADGTCLRQIFFNQAEILESISVFLSTYKRINTGIVVADIVDFITGKKIVTAKCDVPELKDNDWQIFKFNVPLNIRQRYELRLWTTNCRAGQTFTAHYGDNKNFGYLFIGARLIREAELKCKFVYAVEKGTIENKEHK